MPARTLTRRPAWRRALLLLAAALCCGMAAPAHAASATWTVDRPTDSAADGDLATRHGSLRFALAHAASGDLVTFGDVGADAISIASPLVVPAGVAVGIARGQASCGDYHTPLANIQDVPLFTVNPLIQLGAGATLRGVNLGGGDVSVRIAGADAEVCGVGIGFVHDGDGALIVLPPKHAALVIDGAGAVVRRSFIDGAVSVTPNGSDSRIGDSIGGSGDGNDGIRDASVTVGAGPGGAAQRVTIRDPFPRGLQDIAGAGVSGGDDIATHANNWALTPTIDGAHSADGLTVQVTGSASPLSLVDIYLDNQVTIARGAPVFAAADGSFSYSGPLPPGTVTVYAASTLNDPAHPNRVGSSSAWAGPLPVIVSGSEPLLASLGGVIDLSGPAGGPVRPGDVLRFTVTMTNVGTVNVMNIAGASFQPPAVVTVLSTSAKAQGQGSGFIASTSGFSNGALAPGKTETYQIDAAISPAAKTGMAVFSMEVSGSGIVTTPVVGRMRIVADPAQLLTQRIWLARLSR
jgi:uncharacterized repeat protein (TIGR01451 family)